MFCSNASRRLVRTEWHFQNECPDQVSDRERTTLRGVAIAALGSLSPDDGPSSVLRFLRAVISSHQERTITGRRILPAHHRDTGSTPLHGLRSEVSWHFRVFRYTRLTPASIRGSGESKNITWSSTVSITCDWSFILCRTYKVVWFGL